MTTFGNNGHHIEIAMHYCLPFLSIHIHIVNMMPTRCSGIVRSSALAATCHDGPVDHHCSSALGDTMIRRYILNASLLTIVACATTDPKLPETVASADQPKTENAPASSTGPVEVAEIPEVAKVTDIPVRDKVVCKMEKRTGTNRATKVCRTRSSINRSTEEGKKAFDDLRRSQVEY